MDLLYDGLYWMSIKWYLCLYVRRSREMVSWIQATHSEYIPKNTNQLKEL